MESRAIITRVQTILARGIKVCFISFRRIYIALERGKKTNLISHFNPGNQWEADRTQSDYLMMESVNTSHPKIMEKQCGTLVRL